MEIRKHSEKPIELMLLIVPLLITRISGLEPIKGGNQEWYPSPGSKFPLPMVKPPNIGIDNPPSIPSDQSQPEIDMKSVKFSPRYSQVIIAGGSASKRRNEVTPGPHQVTSPPVTSTTVTYARINNVPYLGKNKVRGNYSPYPSLQYLPPGNIEGRMNVSASLNNSQSQSGWALQNRIPPTVFHNSVGNNLIRPVDPCKLSDRSKCNNSNVKRQGGLTAISDIGDLGELAEIDNLSLLNMNQQHNKKMSIGDAIMKFQDTTWIIVDSFKSLVKPIRLKSNVGQTLSNSVRQSIPPISYVKNGKRTVIF
ncbi:unnamed protein product [Allacma fusca]|uniref:Uncharacterized protein n=1 Tax=Allacma fusca TaxID=39272 RepID=A0A8J2PIP9_9HEXA|nr:unnamed protein product [Allacma fusca]